MRDVKTARWLPCRAWGRGGRGREGGGGGEWGALIFLAIAIYIHSCSMESTISHSKLWLTSRLCRTSSVSGRWNSLGVAQLSTRRRMSTIINNTSRAADDDNNNDRDDDDDDDGIQECLTSPLSRHYFWFLVATHLEALQDFFGIWPLKWIMLDHPLNDLHDPNMLTEITLQELGIDAIIDVDLAFLQVSIRAEGMTHLRNDEVEHTPKRKYVGLGRKSRIPLGDFLGNVAWSSRWIHSPWCKRAFMFSNVEVSQNETLWTGARKEDVVRFDVSVADAVVVEVDQRACDLRQTFQPVQATLSSLKIVLL